MVFILKIRSVSPVSQGFFEVGEDHTLAPLVWREPLSLIDPGPPRLRLAQ